MRNFEDISEPDFIFSSIILKGHLPGSKINGYHQISQEMRADLALSSEVGLEYPIDDFP